jgi:hypothetical protein
MKRTEVYLTNAQIKRLDEDRGSIKRAELIRRIIDAYYELKDEKGIKQ